MFFTVGEAKISYKATGIPYQQLHSSADVYKFLMSIWDDDTLDYIESFCVLGLSRGNKVTSFKFISHGGVTGTVADPKLVFQFGLLTNATALILSHNHPSGNLRPSEQDLRLTRKMKEIGTHLDMPIIDHMIVTRQSGYYSFADEGTL